VGSRDYVQVDTTVSEPELGDAFLICSDGLHGYLRTEEIPAILAEGGTYSVKMLIDLANARGGKDNITAIVVEVS
jgi:serine/threonine protein phosphatase PrpC